MIPNIDELFHVASRNLASHKHVKSSHLIHYADHIGQLVADSPMHLAGLSRSRVSPEVVPALNARLGEVLANRRSSREFGSGPLAIGELWSLCYLASGVREHRSAGTPASLRRNVPSSGGLGSVEAFPIVFSVDGLDPGVYHFDSVTHEFVEIASGGFRDWLREDVVYQVEFAAASAAIVLVGKFQDLRAKYGVRGYRSALIDVGHSSQNMYLGAAALGLAVCATTGFVDDELDDALGLDGVDAASLVLVLVGRG